MVNVIGVGPGSKQQMTLASVELINKSDVIIGSKRILNLFPEIEAIDISIGFDKVIDYINENHKKFEISVLATGDTGFYSISNYLNKKLDKTVEISFSPGISSLQYLCSKIKIPWNDIVSVSLHGREEAIINLIKNNSKVAILTGGYNTVSLILNKLLNNKLGNLKVYIGENLSYENEKITYGTISELLNYNYSDLSVIIVINEQPNQFYISNIPDTEFIRTTIPMTKEEIRLISIGKLNLYKDDIVYDIGAGTGSISIEASLHSKKVYAIEYNKDAIALIKQNIIKFQIDNIEIVEGKAPDSLNLLPSPNKVFIGGSGGNLKHIIENINKTNTNKIVINAIMIETVSESLEALQSLNYNIEMVQVTIAKSKKVKSGNMLISNNPIFIITATKNLNID